MSITVHGKLNKQTGKREAQAQTEDTDTTMCVMDARLIILRDPRNSVGLCILRNLNDYISDEHRTGVDDGTRALHNHGTMRATTTIANVPSRQPAETVSMTRLQ